MDAPEIAITLVVLGFVATLIYMAYMFGKQN